MKSFWLVSFLVFAVRSKAVIINGTGEVCAETLCGYGALCPGGTCTCLPGFGPKIRTNSTPAVEYCLGSCKGGCASGAVCRDISIGVRRCVCDTDNGYVLSFFGACVVLQTATTDKQPTLTDSSIKVPETTATDHVLPNIRGSSTEVPEIIGPSTGYVISIAFNGVLVAIVVILVILLFRLRRHAEKTASQNMGHVLDGKPTEDNSDRTLANIEVISPSYENSVANGFQSSQENDNRKAQTSNYVNTAMYEDIVDSNYINTTDPQQSSDYSGLQIDHPMEQVQYEKLQTP